MYMDIVIYIYICVCACINVNRHVNGVCAYIIVYVSIVYVEESFFADSWPFKGAWCNARE